MNKQDYIYYKNKKGIVIYHVPFILHTHLNEEDKTFSLPDKSFLEKFSCTYNKLFSKKIVIGALINVQGRKFQLIYIEEDQEYVSCLMNI